MSGDWGRLECPYCGTAHPPPEGAASDCEALILDLLCPACHRGFEVRVELWRYFGIERELPSRQEDR